MAAIPAEAASDDADECAAQENSESAEPESPTASPASLLKEACSGPPLSTQAPGPEVPPRARSRAPERHNLIAFPAPVKLEVSYGVADPTVPEHPRIVEVPEQLEVFPPTSLLDGLQLSPAEPHPAAPADHLELPHPPVEVSRRLYAGVVDCMAAFGAAAVFGAVAYGLLPKITLHKPVVLALAAVPLLLWAAYQYLMVVYGGRTAGMRIARIRLSSFEGAFPGKRQRRNRVLGLYFSAASLMMGLLWTVVDVNTLGWHDRISKTYLIAE